MAAPFHEIRFPPHISRGARAILRSRTSVFTSGGGQERRVKRWSRQLRVWDAKRGIKTTSDLEEVRAFHYVMDGRHAGFRFQDFSDYRAESQQVDTSTGGPTYQLRKAYTAAGAVTKWRDITKPVKGTTTLVLNGETCVVLEDGQTIEDWSMLFGEQEFGFNPETAYRFTLDTTTGLLTPVIPSELAEEDELFASCEFDVPARFDSDDFAVTAHSRGKNWEYGEIRIKELRR